MITKWAKNTLMAMMSQTGVTRYNVPVAPYDASGTVYYAAAYNMKDDTSRWPICKYAPSVIGNPSSATYSAICIGSGTTAPTDTDYDLAERLTSGWSASINCSNTEDENENPVIKYAISLSNTSSSAITIGEIGLFGKCTAVPVLGGSGGMVGVKTNARILIDRTVFETPIVLAAGSTTIIDYVISITNA